MKLSDFSYHLPEQLIAEKPATTRSASRLLSLDCNSGAISHGRFTDIAEQLGPKDLLVFNDTRVIPARLFAQKTTGGRVEILIERMRSDTSALVQMRANKAPKPGNLLSLLQHENSEEVSEPVLEVTAREGDFFIIETIAKSSLAELVERYGHMPLPPYIKRADDIEDQSRYQTVYSRNPGAVAAPTAGLHFDEPLLARLESRGVGFAFLTLHVGAGTFQPVRVEHIQQHRMHRERIEVTAEVCAAINRCKAQGGRVVAVGTTSVRSLEATALQSNSEDSDLQPFSGETDIFIYPGFDFKVVDAIVTNFHLPESTLLMLVSAFADKKMLLDAYAEAIGENYRFFSYGDAMFLYRAT
ncbi:MAG: tRNA preQ1(34) S-adenosylmethionine ribosyltransferase-isomerase QueA [Pseudomonadales bacterium]|nr:tRNA preQ1(34) S-adenosylmethionine ribosyltransferase-isomerase QueA [Pseudomonadales bacterium]